MVIDPKELLSLEGPRPFLPRRWVVERTSSWLRQNRRLSLWIRAATRQLGSLHLRSEEPPYGEEIGSLVRVFGQFRYRILGSSGHGSGPRFLGFKSSFSVCVFTIDTQEVGPEQKTFRIGETSEAHFERLLSGIMITRI